jgi:tRNA-dihydrouridine synthase B
LKIGKVELKDNLFLAPMAGVTNLPFRLMCVEEGCSLTYTEMVSAKALYFEDKKTMELLETTDKDSPCGVQIFGSDPEIIAKVIKTKINKMDFALIDINAGCPAPKIVKNNEGSALMKTPDLIGKIIENAVKVSKKPVTLKIRAGWNDEQINAVEVARVAERAGAAAVAIHGRTREQFYSGKADWDVIKKVKDSVSIPVIGNGDVDSRRSAQRMIESTGCDGVMVGRAALGNPWIFNADKVFQVSDELKIQKCKTYFENLLKIKPEKVALGEIRKHASWFTKGIRGSGEFRNKINKTTSVAEVFLLIDEYRNKTVQKNL